MNREGRVLVCEAFRHEGRGVQDLLLVQLKKYILLWMFVKIICARVLQNSKFDSKNNNNIIPKPQPPAHNDALILIIQWKEFEIKNT